jgi:hypothetical protein
MHGGIESVKYWYSNPRFSSGAVDHAFRYISAVTGIKFVKDRSSPRIWRSDDEQYPASVKIDLGDDAEIRRIGQSLEKTGDDPDGTMLKNDPLEEIIKRLSLKARIGPLAEESSSGRPADVPRLSLLIASLVARLSDLDMIERGSRVVDLWPNGAPFAVALTHDIDIARRSVMGSIRLLWHKDPPGRLKGLVDSMKSTLGARNPYDKAAEWVKLERDYELKSTFFVFAGDRTHRLDPKYRLVDLSDWLDLILGSGFELALHSGIDCYSGDGLLAARSMLEAHAKEKVAGLRPHYLSAKLPEYWRVAAETGFAYTSCLGFDDRMGYFNGIDLPFMPFDIENDTAIEIVEIPLAIMDCGLIDSEAADSDEVFERGRDMIDSAERRGSLIVLDWHQRTRYDPDYPGWGRLFKKLLDYASGRRAYFATMRKIASLLKEKMAGRD